MEIGQKVVCIHKGKWKTMVPPNIIIYGIGPNYNEDCLITGIEKEDGIIFLWLKGYPNLYNSKHFRPLDYDFADDVLSKVKPKEKIEC